MAFTHVEKLGREDILGERVSKGLDMLRLTCLCNISVSMNPKVWAGKEKRFKDVCLILKYHKCIIFKLYLND